MIGFVPIRGGPFDGSSVPVEAASLWPSNYVVAVFTDGGTVHLNHLLVTDAGQVFYSFVRTPEMQT